jgi:hypothetical protein
VKNSPQAELSPLWRSLTQTMVRIQVRGTPQKKTASNGLHSVEAATPTEVSRVSGTTSARV